ncbi:MAG: alpha/beta hydrolase [Candidatus Rokubacteria bacterium]|nr:alpha/beta hydrolase [Candidatus Rokubacteria bacterium]
MPRIENGGVGIHYQEAGAGEPLVLIMGWGGDHTAWAFQVPAFAAAYRVIALDNRGVGQSDVPPGPWSIADMAEDTRGLLDALGIERAHVAGASMGGMIAQELALTHPDRVRTLQLHCTLARSDAYQRLIVETLIRVRAHGDPKEYTRAVLPWLLARKTVVERPELVEFLIARAVDHPYPTSLDGLVRQAEAIGDHATLPRLAGIRVPTLVTVGSEDILVPPLFSRELHAAIAGAELAVIPDAGHLHFLEQPEAFNQVALDFLARAHSR